MIKHRSMNLILAVVATAFVSTSAVAAAAHPRHAATTSAANAKSVPANKTADAPKATEKVVDYKDLESNIGADLSIETTFNTVRRGTLVKYTNPGLIIRLGPEAGSIELDVPAETIRRVSIVTQAPQTAKPPQENSSAKKN